MSWIEDSIRLSHGARKLRLRIHPTEVARLRPALDEWIQEYSKSNPIELIEDEKVGAAGLILDSNDGRIDMQLQSQLNRLREELA